MSWPMVKLGDVAPSRPLKNPKIEDAERVWQLNLDMVEANSGQVIEKCYQSFDEAGASTHWFDANHVLYSKLRPYLNKVVTPDEQGLATTELVPLLPDPKRLDRHFLAYYLRSSEFVQWISEQVAGAKMPRVSMDLFWNHEIPLPPLAEQKRIAAILDKADAIRRKRQQAIQLADDFLRAVFLEMFGDPVTNPKGWEVKKWNEVLTIVNGRNQKAVEDPHGEYPICGSGGYMAKANDWLTEANAVIIGRKGNINSPILMKERFWNVDTAFGLVPNRSILSHNYLFFFCEFFDFERLNKAVTIPSLTKADLLQIEIPLPPFATQHILDQIIDKIASMKDKHTGNLECDLFSALSQKAFSGKL